MNKIFNINLGGYPFTVDADAFSHLDAYLKTIRNHFTDSESCEEIATDIEARMAELFRERLSTNEIIGMKDVNEVIAIMGTPEDFGAESLFEEEIPRRQSMGATSSVNRKFFRDPDNKVLGGVTSGLSAYFGIEDPIWLRLAFVLSVFLGFGFPIGIYIIAWIIMPEAKTAADKLAMKGEAINVSSIAKSVESEVSHIKERVQKFGEDITSNNGKKKTETPPESEIS